MDRTVVLFILALFFSHTVFANSGGITGRSGQQGPTCNDSGCHNGSDYQSNLSYDGLLTVEPNQSIDMNLLHAFIPPINSGMSMAGINISVSGGMLGQGVGLQKQGSELTHMFSSLARLPDNEKDWRFKWTAPETEGTVTLYACAEAVDRTGTPDNDDASAACIEKSIQVQQKAVSSDCGDSQSSTNCTLGLNASESGTVDKAGDIDFYALSITQAGTLTLSTSGNVDTVGVFFAQGNDKYLAADNDSGSGSNFSLSQSVSPGTYFIHVRGLKDSDLGAYTVTSSFSASGGSSSDCGDSMSSTNCTLGLNASESGTVEKAGDIDFYALSITQAGTLNLSTSGNVDTVGVFFAQGNDKYLAADNDSGSGSNFSLSQSVSPGTYFIHVRGLKDSDLGAYTLTSSFSASGGSSSDCGDSMSSTNCTLGLNASESGSVDKAGDIDFYALSVTQTGTLTLSTSGNVDTVGVFFAQGNDQHLTADNDSGSGSNFSLSQSVSPGTYFIHVRGLKASDLGAYTLTSSFSASTGSSDCGDSMSSINCTLGLNASESGSVDKAGDIDFYALSIIQAGTLTLSTSGNVDTVGVFFEQGNNDYLAADNDSGSGRNFSLSQSVSPGTYFIHVRGLKASDLGAYTVTSSFSASVGSSSDCGDSMSATNCTLGLNASESGTVDKAGDIDFYALSITQSGTLNLSTSGNVDTVGVFFAQGNDKYLAADNDSGSGRNFSLSQSVSPGTYFIHVRGLKASDLGAYTVTSSFSASGGSSSDCGDSMSSTNCTLGLNASESGTVEKAGDIDFYALSITQAGTLNLSTSGNVDTVGVFFAQGNDKYLAADNDSGSGRNFSLSQSVSPGTYFIHVRGLKASDLGAYKITSSFSASGGSSDCGDSMSATNCTLGLNASESGSVDKAGDIDFYALSVTQTGTLTLSTSGNVDTVGVFFAQGNDQHLTADNDSGSGRNFSLSQSVSPGTYYIHVRGLKAADLGVYTVTSSFDSGAKAYYADNVSAQIVQSKCVACHVQNGAAASSRLQFERSNVTNYQMVNNATWQMFLSESGVSSDYVLSKVQGSLGHGGGQQLAFGSEEYIALGEYFGLITGEELVTSSKGFWNGVGLLSNRQTLRKAALIFAGRLPTDEEYAFVADGKNASLKTSLRNVMQGDGFHQFLTDGANDKLLTYKFFQNGGEFLDTNFSRLPTGATLAFEARKIGGEVEEEHHRLHRDAIKSFAKAAPELIAYVVENEKPYSEILTADYTMVNPRLNEYYRGGASFNNPNDQKEIVPAQLKGFMLEDETFTSDYTETFGLEIFTEGPIITWPHAGILNDPAFLERYPSTATNRNRARSRWTQYLFLDFDIEKSAARSNDPDALADKDNPTMKNPNCTVCHETLDPVAGAFQNYGDVGYYRDQWGGKDSLADTYKWPVDGNSPYQEGDTWYRDMRAPGFNSETVPDTEHSLQWLAQKIINDDRFAVSAVKFWWPAVIGSAAVYAPEVSSDNDYESKKAVYNAQSLYIANVADGLRSHMNLKDTLVDIVMSEWFRGSTIAEEASELHSSNKSGKGRLLSPELLDKKTKAVFGLSWGEEYPDWNNFERHSELLNTHKLTYGGIDSDGVISRAQEMTSIMSQLALTHAAEMACEIVVNDFILPEKEKLLFKGINKNSTPSLISSQVFQVDGYEPEINNTSSQLFTSTRQQLEKGSYLTSVSFLNDFWDNDTHITTDLIIDKLRVKNSQNVVTHEFQGNDFEGLAYIGCGGEFDEDDFNIWGNCTVDIPIEIDVSGQYSIEVFAYQTVWNDDGWGPAGDYGVSEMLVGISVQDALSQNSVGSELSISIILSLIEKAWGEFLSSDDPEVKAIYQLFVKSWESKKSLEDMNNHIAEDGVSCNFPFWEYNRPEDNYDGWVLGDDPQAVMSAWRTVILYIMTDYRYLHE